VPAEGTVLAGRYRLGELLGQGGMGEVRRARDVRIGRDVAVKLLRPELVRDPAFEGRLRREAQSAASLHGPGVVAVYDTGEDIVDGVPTAFIVMELVAGRTLRDMLAVDGPMSPQQAVTVTRGICVALDEAHRAGIIHRDIKPGNVMLTPAGDVKVMDFGIARLTATAATMTQTAAVTGTAHYLSPEQARGEHVDARSDVYSTGCVLYELLTGSPPFTGETAVAIAYQHVREDPIPPSKLASLVSPELDAVVLKTLAKNPANRYQSAGELRDDLQRVLEGAPVIAPPLLAETAIPAPVPPPTTVLIRDSPPRSRGRAFAYALLILAVLGVFTVAVLGARAVLAGGSGDLETPDVVGQSITEARTILNGAGLQVGDVTFRYSANRARGVVMAQDPAHPILLRHGESVALVVSKGIQYVVIPADVVGEPQAEAIAELKTAGFTIGQIAEVNSRQPAGQVLKTTPAAGGEAAKGAAIVLTVSNGMGNVPGVVGMDAGTAAQRLQAAGFAVVEQSASAYDAKLPTGQVVSQTPAPGTTAAENSTVDIFLNEPPPKPTPTPSGGKHSPSPTPTATRSTPTPPPAG
jgi:serine/threonine-protein kinase